MSNITFIKPAEIVKLLPYNSKGTDYYFGDVHGNYTRIMKFLDKVHFDSNVDRCIFVGDLVDRGSENVECIEMIDNQSMFSVRGNHDDLFLTSFATKDPNATESELDSYSLMEYNYFSNYGDWTYQYDEQYLKTLADTMVNWPIVILVEGADGNIENVVVHAQLPTDMTIDCLQTKPITDSEIMSMLWEREVALTGKTNVPEINARIICGHTPAKNIKRFDNYVLIDTSGGRPTRRITCIDSKGGEYEL